MIKIDLIDEFGWEAAIIGMRNPMNSWKLSDTEHWIIPELGDVRAKIGENDYKLMKKLVKAGTDHRKFMRMVVVYADITAPLYWWKEFDTYKVGTVANSCSTMHKISAKEFEIGDFSTDHMLMYSRDLMKSTIEGLNYWRNMYLNGGTLLMSDESEYKLEPKSKIAWWQMIQLLPSSYNQKRTVMVNYEVLANIYKSRRYHKLDEWQKFCDWIEDFVYSELITGDFKEE